MPIQKQRHGGMARWRRGHEHRGSVAANSQTFSFINREFAQGFHYVVAYRAAEAQT